MFESLNKTLQRLSPCCREHTPIGCKKYGYFCVICPPPLLEIDPTSGKVTKTFNGVTTSEEGDYVNVSYT